MDVFNNYFLKYFSYIKVSVYLFFFRNGKTIYKYITVIGTIKN